MLSAANAAQLFVNSGNNLAASAGLQTGAAGGMNAQQADKVSKDFESMFVSQMLEQMFGDSLGEDAFGDSTSSDVYKSMMMDAYGKQIENAGGIGIASYVKKELLKLQEVGQ